MDTNKPKRPRNTSSSTNLSSEVVSALVKSVLKNQKLQNTSSQNITNTLKNSSDSESEKEMENFGGSKSTAGNKTINQIEKSYLIQIL